MYHPLTLNGNSNIINAVKRGNTWNKNMGKTNPTNITYLCNEKIHTYLYALFNLIMFMHSIDDDTVQWQQIRCFPYVSPSDVERQQQHYQCR
jgi:hypothetical protein